MCLPLFFPGRCGQAHVAFSSDITHSEGKAAENILPLDSTLAICPIYRRLGCCLSSYFVSFMLKSWQIHKTEPSPVFHTQCFQGCAGEKGQDNINSTQFPQDLEMWATLCVAFLYKTLMNSFRSSLVKRVEVF